MLEKKNRICKNKEFDQVFKTGQSFYAKEFGIKSANNNQIFTRMGLLVGLKISKKAVVRNKLKRQIRSIISQEMPKIKDGKDIVIIALPQIINIKFSDLKISVSGGLKKLNLYK